MTTPNNEAEVASYELFSVCEDCPECGAEIVGPKPFYDGDPVQCSECDYETGISVNEDGSHYLQENAEVLAQPGETAATPKTDE